MADTSCRLARPDDSDELHALAAEFAKASSAQLGISHRSLRAHYCRGTAGTHPIFVAEQRGQLIGFLALRGPELKSLFVSERHRSRGVARALITATEAKGLSPKFAYSEDAAVGLYRALGWQSAKTSLGILANPTFDRLAPCTLPHEGLCFSVELEDGACGLDWLTDDDPREQLMALNFAEFATLHPENDKTPPIERWQRWGAELAPTWINWRA